MLRILLLLTNILAPAEEMLNHPIETFIYGAVRIITHLILILNHGSDKSLESPVDSIKYNSQEIKKDGGSIIIIKKIL